MTQIEDRLQEIGDILNNKHSSYYVFKTTQSEFNIKFPTPIRLNPHRNYELALHYFSTANHLVNVSDDNNRFVYSHDAGKTWTTLKLESGAYEMRQIADEVKRLMAVHKHYDEKASPLNYYINIGVNLSTFKSFVEITNSSFKVNFQAAKTIKDLLGFNARIIGVGYNISDVTVQITRTSAILIHSDLISGSYINGIESDILFSFPAYTVPTGYKMNIFPSTMMYLPINRKTINNMSFTIKNERGHILDFKGEDIVIALHLRQV
jgi:hypothetical protein